MLLFVKCLVALGCLYLGLRFLEAYFVNSLVAEGVRASAGGRVPVDPRGYDAARTGVVLAAIAFLFSQMAGGVLLRNVFASGATGWGELFKSVVAFTGIFFLATLLVVAVFIVLH
jgi:hypothetical protein